MIRHSVVVTDTAIAAIEEHARFIATAAEQPAHAAIWLDAVSQAMESLALAPRRTHLAAEDAYVAFEVRQYVVGTHLLLFTIDDASRTVTIVGLRHGHRRPRPQELDEHVQ